MSNIRSLRILPLVVLMAVSFAINSNASEISSAPFSGATSDAVTVNWGTTFGGGTVYYVRLSSVASASLPISSGPTLNTFYDFSGLAANTTYYGYVSTTSSTGHVLTGSGSTLAEAPLSAVFAGLAYSSASLSWSGGTNPAWTTYEYELSVSSTFGSIAASAAGAVTTGWLTGLTEGTTYYGRVRAINNEGAATAYLYSPPGKTLSAGVISAAVFSGVTSSAVTVNWGTTFGSGTLYYVSLSTIASPYAAVSSGTTVNTYYVFSGLSANTSYYGYVSTASGAGYVLAGSGPTLAESAGAISAAAFSYVDPDALKVNWGTTFSGGTLYYVSLSTIANPSAAAFSTTTVDNFYYFTGLDVNTIYYGYASTTSGAGYVLTGSGSTLAVTPSSAAFAGVGYSSAALSWYGGVNPGGTLYEYELSVSSSFAVVISSSIGAVTTGWLTDLTEGTAYYGRVRAINNDWIYTAYAYTPGTGITLAQASTAAPTVGIFQPENNSFVNSLSQVSGTAADDAAVSSVTLTIYRSSDGYYWNSSTWVAGQIWLNANVAGSSWTYAGVPVWVSGSAYGVVAKAKDSSGNWSVTYSTSAFTYDATAPTSRVAMPAANSQVSTFTCISGTAMDAGGVAEVRVSVKRWSDAGYWSGSVWVSTETWNLASGTTAWVYAGISSAALTGGTTYLAMSKAYDLAGNISDPFNSSSTFTYVGAAASPVGVISSAPFSAVGISSLTVNWGTTYSSSTLYYVSISSTGSSSAAVSSGTTLNTYYNFSGLSANTTYYGYASTTSGAGYVLTGSGSALAVAPSSAAFAGVAYSSAALSWSGGVNPAWTRYEYALSVSSSFGVIASSAAGAVTTGWLTGLAEGTTYYGRVRAVNNEGIATAYASAAATGLTQRTPAGVISGAAFSGVSAGALTVNWGSTFSTGTVYSVRLATTASAASPVLSATTTASAYNFSGLSANTTYYGYASTTSGAGYVLTGSGSTLAVAPSSAAFAGVAYSSAALSWSGGVNPSWTRYNYQLAVSSSFGSVAASATGTVTTGWLNGLTEGTTYYGRVRAVNNEGVSTAYAYTPATAVALVYHSTAIPTGSAANISGTALGINSISWTWSAGSVTSADYFALYSSSGVSIATVTFASTASYVRTGLATNAAYRLFVAGKNSNGEGPLAASPTVYTLAAAPAGLAAPQVFVSSAVLSWESSGNSTGTTAQLWRSVDNSTFTNVFEGAALSFTDTSLEECSAYYFKARNKNGDGLYSGYVSTISFTTLASTPTPPSGLSAEALEGSRIALAWDFSPWTGVTQYKLYYGSGTGAIDYNTPYAVFSSTVSAWTTPALTAGNTYKFGLRAANRCGIEEKNTSVYASVLARGSLTGVSASIKVPQTGKKIEGNNVTVMAEITGAVSQVASVRFQYRVLGGGAWTDIVAANSNHLNPDTDSPYFVQWNVDALGVSSSTIYELRAQATDIYTVIDSTPSAITVIIGDSDYDTKEILLGSGDLQKEQKINNAVTNTVQAADDGTPLVTKVVIPPGAINVATVSVTLVNNPASKPVPPQGAQDLNLSVKVNLSNSQSLLSGGQAATLTLTYKDDDGDGIVDDYGVAVDQLKMYSASDAGGAWTMLASSVDKVKKVVSGATSHFSFFAVFAGPAANLDTVRVYPVPYIPNDGNNDNGKPYSAGVTDSGIIFDNLPSVVTIKIFTLSGKLVADHDTASSQGKIQWDVKNNAGKNVASGGYIAVISSPGCKTITKKLLVVR